MTQELQYETRNGWEQYTNEADLAQIDRLAADYAAFLSASKTERETVDNVVAA